MPVDLRLTAKEQAQARTELEDSLANSDAVRKLFGKGLLGNLFPSIFGEAPTSILGRRQGGIHEFSLDEHTIQVIAHAHADPEFAGLSKKDQTDLLLAALLHDVGKNKGGGDPYHDQVTMEMTYGILGTLGYPSQRVERIANLLLRHTELSYWPDRDTLAPLRENNPDWLLVAHYRRPNVSKLLRILNEADIRGIVSRSTYFNTAVEQHLRQLERLLDARAQEINRNAIPILTSRLPPNGFGLYEAPKDFAYFAHKTSCIDVFLRHSGSIQSRNTSISASLVTRDSIVFHDTSSRSSDGGLARSTAGKHRTSQSLQSNHRSLD
jgi:hypothetical protein